MKRCPRCGITKPFDCFYEDSSKSGGRKSRCKDCIRPVAAERERRWRAANPEKEREKNRMRHGRDSLKRHDGPEERARLWQLQGGCCYLCGRPFLPGQEVHVDHDHSCCPSGQHTDSCRYCRRGLAHAACNQIIGLIGEDAALLRVIADNFEPVQAAARQRIARKAAQGELFGDGEVSQAS